VCDGNFVYTHFFAYGFVFAFETIFKVRSTSSSPPPPPPPSSSSSSSSPSSSPMARHPT
jgi:hypothetical protein